MKNKKNSRIKFATHRYVCFVRAAHFTPNQLKEIEMIDLNVLIDEPADTYHSRAKEFLSSHQLIDFMRCPYLYAKKRSGLIPQTDSPAYFLGRAAHTRILEGIEVYEKEYAVGGPVNPNTGKPFGSTTKKFLEWQEAQAKPVIPFDKAELVESMNAGVRQNLVACEILSQGKAEGVVRVGCDIVSEKFEAEKTSSATTSGLLNETKIKGPERGYLDFACQIRIDWLNPMLGIVDLKTCDDLTWFESDARKFHYVHQLAFYQNVLEAAINERNNVERCTEPTSIRPNAEFPVYIIAVEKKEPFRCGV